MDELTNDLIERTGMEPEQAREAAGVVVRHLIEHLPEPAARAVEEFAAGRGDDDGEERRKKATIAAVAATTAAVNVAVLPGAR